MRYRSVRKYPITQMKKELQANKPERFADLSVGAAAGLLAMVFAEGLIFGYVCGKSFSRR